MKKHYEVRGVAIKGSRVVDYHYVGYTWATSPKKAINNIQSRTGYLIRCPKVEEVNHG